MNVEPLVDGLESLSERKDTGELAFLCLNGQAENHIRDLVAFSIANSNPDWTISCERNRVDLSILDSHEARLDIEFKLGYVAGVANKRERAPTIRSALKDFEKRDGAIANCIGLMDFESQLEADSLRQLPFKHPAYIRQCVERQGLSGEAISVVKRIWSDRSLKCVTVDCGSWKCIAVKIHFVIISNAIE